MAPFKKVGVFGQRKAFQAPEPLNTEDPDADNNDLEAGSFLNERQRAVGPSNGTSQTSVAAHHQGDNPYLDEYRA
jgi:hypothetical protein